MWVVSLLLVAYGLLGTLLGAMLLEDAISHGEEDVVILMAVISLLLSAAQVTSGIGLFFGARWGRTGALTVCGINVLAVAVAAANDGVGTAPAWIAVAVNAVLVFVLLGEKIHGWTGGDK
ncbi:hypothetical protein ACIBF5_00790 [Micromonospora sp. NPDC050417]|uniref:hypothetical protein n=1 Tax=Micromonospora sp. NPDC050417 TaxID=3364280 RepID=UPI003798F0B6